VSKPTDFRPGQRVRNTRTGEEATVHAIWAQSAEDNVEVLLDDGSYTIWDGYRYVESAEVFE
jgi:hypothetical protein